MKLIECVANVSEGCDVGVLNTLAAAVESGGGRVLHSHPTRGAGRTVITFAAAPEAIEEAGFRLVEAAIRHIDMRRYHGVHPCIGAADVVPFVPLGDATLQECIECAERTARRVGDELGLPVYLYGEAARQPERRRLSYLRRGGYAALAARIASGTFPPDYGPSMVGTAGASAIGARPLMVAYNISLNTRSIETATRIAEKLRSSGYLKRGDAESRPVRVPGCFPNCEAIGWFIEDFNCAQVSINVRDYKAAPLHRIFEKVRELAAPLGVTATGSEIIGLVPRDALVDAGRFYSGCAESEADLVEAAIQGLGLNDKGPFDPDRKILERRLAVAGWNADDAV